MKILANTYTKALQRAIPQLEFITDHTKLCEEDIVLVDENDINKLIKQYSIPLSLIVLTKDKETFNHHLGPHKLKKKINKFSTIQDIHCQIFNERHPIRYYTSTVSAPWLEKLFEDIIVESFVDHFNYNETSNVDLFNREPCVYDAGVQYFITNVPDMLDPPIDLLTETVIQQSYHGDVAMLSYPPKGEFDQQMMAKSDHIIVIANAGDHSAYTYFKSMGKPTTMIGIGDRTKIKWDIRANNTLEIQTIPKLYKRLLH